MVRSGLWLVDVSLVVTCRVLLFAEFLGGLKKLLKNIKSISIESEHSAEEEFDISGSHFNSNNATAHEGRTVSNELK